jgi:lipopolysaccharide biosynthesis glycosyltransferase
VKPEEYLYLFASSSDLFAPHLATMIASVLHNCPAPDQLKFHILDGGLSADSKEKLSSLVTRHGSRVVFIEPDLERLKSLTLNRCDRMHLSIYFKLLIPELLDRPITKAIQLDCDMVLEDDIRKLWEIDLGDYPAGAVENFSTPPKVLNTTQSEYFNSGLVVLNLPVWRKQQISEKALECVATEPDRITMADQCALNLALESNWYRLPPIWNQQAGIYRKRYCQRSGYSQNDLKEARENPSLIHFAGERKPWFFGSFHPLADRYFYYRKKTPWADLPPPAVEPKTLFKMVSRPDKLVKKFFFRAIFRKRKALL